MCFVEWFIETYILAARTARTSLGFRRFRVVILASLRDLMFRVQHLGFTGHIVSYSQH